MPTIDDSIRKIDNVICRHLDNIEDSSRGVISQDILEQLMKLVNHIMLKFYANGRDISISEENIAKAVEFAQVNSEINTLYKFRNYLQIVTTQYTLDEDGSERLMLKYYQYLLEAKNLLSQYYGIQILHNLDKFPLHLDDTLQEYYAKISEKIEQYPVRTDSYESNKYYILKTKPLFLNRKIYYEITFAPVDDRKNKSKSNRVIAFTKIPVKSNYASKFHLVQDSIEILGKTMPIIIIDGWEVSIRDCEFKNFILLIKGEKKRVPYPEQRLICDFLTKKKFTLNDLMDFPDKAYDKITLEWKNNLNSSVFIPILDDCRNLIRSGRNGQNVLRYLLYNMNNVIIKSQYSSGYYSRYYEEWINTGNNNLSRLYLSNGCRQFDSLPFNRSPIGHNPKLGAIFDCIPCKDKRPELFARFIRNNTEGKGQLFTDIDELSNFPDYQTLIKKYNDSLWDGHRPESDLMLEHNQVFINDYKLDTCKIIEKLQKLAESGVENYSDDVDIWLLLDDYEIDCDEKKNIINSIFSESRVGVIYGSAGVGKSTLINHVSHYLNAKEKLYLTQTNPAKENLMRKIDADNATFSTIASFLNQGSSITEYELLVVDECSTVSNKDMVKVLEKANFKMLLLVGDTYQIDAIQFGNWFSVLKSFLPESSVFELTQPHRTKDERLLELWDKVRHMEDTAKEVIERESYSLKVDETLLSSLEKGEAILCLNYDGLYGINNINRFLQESNHNPAVTWDIQQYKVGDPILFLDSDRFRPIIHNNMKGILQGVEIIDAGTMEERIQFDVEIQKAVDERDVLGLDLELLECFEEEEKSLIRFYVHKLKSADEDGEDSSTAVPFQVAYAVSIHKAQGLEYDSVKIVITDEVEELVTHNIFYTAITRAREKLKIYWTPEVEEKVINRIKPRDISKDVELLKNYLTDKQQTDSLAFLL
ncbi:ATP-dependent RecD-like DNA helicase [uncultured Clostridium sp.]|uniref:ATP-dependent DNA helicase n=1 Tax=uncultured Clostridium sp. TaxID=59620 RepID=UPI0027DAE8EA|nr:ATP-dependent RecD-like DNA helicase [uncultured Clostridium sp.]